MFFPQNQRKYYFLARFYRVSGQLLRKVVLCIIFYNTLYLWNLN